MSDAQERELSRLERALGGFRDLGETWEAELILSAGLTFALLQLPGALDNGLLRLETGLGGAAFSLAVMGYTYLKLALYVIIACFALHLLSRAYWIALIGLVSAFPDGIDWSRVPYGPIGREEYPELSPSLEQLTRGADRFASSLFAFAFVMSAGFVLSLFLIPVIGLIALGLRRWALTGVELPTLIIAFAVIIAAPAALAGLLDRGLGDRLPAFLQGWVRRAYRINYRLFGQRYYGPLSLTIFTNTRRRRMYPAIVLFVLGLVAVFMADLVSLRGQGEVSTIAWVPTAAGPAAVEPVHYEELREAPLQGALLPSIQSDVITGPYVRLFLPYDPDTDDALVAERCSGLDPVRTSALTLRRRAEPPADSILRRALACNAALWTVVLNGDTLAPDYAFFRHPVTGARGLVAYLPTAPMPPGRNLLYIERPDEPSPDGDPELDRYWIPFWK